MNWWFYAFEAVAGFLVGFYVLPRIWRNDE